MHRAPACTELLGLTSGSVAEKQWWLRSGGGMVDQKHCEGCLLIVLPCAHLRLACVKILPGAQLIEGLALRLASLLEAQSSFAAVVEGAPGAESGPRLWAQPSPKPTTVDTCCRRVLVVFNNTLVTCDDTLTPVMHASCRRRFWTCGGTSTATSPSARSSLHCGRQSRRAVLVVLRQAQVGRPPWSP